MLSLLPYLSLPYAKAAMGFGLSPDKLPEGWVRDNHLRNAVTPEPSEYEGPFRAQMRTLYECMAKHNEGKSPFEQVHLVLKEEAADSIRFLRHGGVFSTTIDGFGFLTHGRIHEAYYIDQHEDIGFRVYRGGHSSHAYFRTYNATPEDFSRFIDQAVFRRDKNPRLSF